MCSAPESYAPSLADRTKPQSVGCCRSGSAHNQTCAHNPRCGERGGNELSCCSAKPGGHVQPPTPHGQHVGCFKGGGNVSMQAETTSARHQHPRKVGTATVPGSHTQHTGSQVSTDKSLQTSFTACFFEGACGCTSTTGLASAPGTTLWWSVHARGSGIREHVFQAMQWGKSLPQTVPSTANHVTQTHNRHAACWQQAVPGRSTSRPWQAQHVAFRHPTGWSAP